MWIPGPIEAFRGWAKNTREEIAENGLQGGIRSGRHLGYGSSTRLLQNIGKATNYGTPVFHSNWDLLIVLDGCRYDLFEEVSGDYEYIKSVEETYSIASGSKEWMKKTFSDEFASEVSKSGYVTGNPFSSKVDLSMLKFVDEVWKYAWDDNLQTIPPRPITDRAISHARNGDADRLIVHYMQPHYPFIPDPIGDGIKKEEFETGSRDNVWMQIRGGELSREDVWPSYRANLKHVLEDVELLVKNTHLENAVITSDHGNALGEWGVYGHLNYVPVPAVKRVPWCEVATSDEGTHNPLTYDQTEVEDNLQSQLKALGYQ